MIASLDHLVLTVADIDATVAFYRDVLGMRKIAFGEGRLALAYGAQKINLHRVGQEFEPKSARPTPGSADLCFLLDVSLDTARGRLRKAGIAVEEGPVDRTGATGPIRSLYVRDPDGNLIELSIPADPSSA